MPITISNSHASGSGTDSSSYTTAAFTPTSGNMYLYCVLNAKLSGEPEQPTITGTNGFNIQWNLIHTKLWDTSGSPLKRISVFWGIAISSNASTITASCGSNTQSGWVVIVNSVVGFHRLNPIVLSNIKDAHVDNSTEACNITLNPFQNSLNAGYGVFGRAANIAVAPSGSYTELADVGATSPDMRLQTQWAVNATNPGINPTGTNTLAGIAFELYEVSSTKSFPHRQYMIINSMLREM